MGSVGRKRSGCGVPSSEWSVAVVVWEEKEANRWKEKKMKGEGGTTKRKKEERRGGWVFERRGMGERERGWGCWGRYGGERREKRKRKKYNIIIIIYQIIKNNN